MGLPGEMRPLFLPDEGCVFLHFDFSQQEPGIAGWVSGDPALSDDFRMGDVYINLGRRLGLIGAGSASPEVKRVRKLMKVLMLAILYGKFIRSVATDLGISYNHACTHMANFRTAYATLFGWLKSYVSQSMERGWAENILRFRAAFNPQHGFDRGHLSRSCQNFPIQASAAACFQLTGIYLADLGCDIRLPIHDAYVLNCPNDRRVIADTRMKIMAGTATAVGQLFPGLTPRRDIEVLHRFAKDGHEDSFEQWVAAVEGGTCAQN
jgi:DNA polymerase-1